MLLLCPVNVLNFEWISWTSVCLMCICGGWLPLRCCTAGNVLCNKIDFWICQTCFCKIKSANNVWRSVWLPKVKEPSLHQTSRCSFMVPFPVCLLFLSRCVFPKESKPRLHVSKTTCQQSSMKNEKASDELTEGKPDLGLHTWTAHPFSCLFHHVSSLWSGSRWGSSEKR